VQRNRVATLARGSLVNVAFLALHLEYAARHQHRLAFACFRALSSCWALGLATVEVVKAISRTVNKQ
jgi:hypothetical protein